LQKLKKKFNALLIKLSSGKRRKQTEAQNQIEGNKAEKERRESEREGELRGGGHKCD